MYTADGYRIVHIYAPGKVAGTGRSISPSIDQKHTGFGVSDNIAGITEACRTIEIVSTACSLLYLFKNNSGSHTAANTERSQSVLFVVAQHLMNQADGDAVA